MSEATNGAAPEQLLELARLAVSRAERSGADAAEATIRYEDGLTARVRGDDVDRFQSTTRKRLGLRVRVAGAGASVSTTDLAPEALEELAARAVALARETAPDESSALPEDGGAVGDAAALELCDESSVALDPERAIELARVAEEAARATDPAIRNSEGSEFRAARGTRVVASSHGLGGAYRSSAFTVSSMPVAERDGSRQVDYWYTAARRHDAIRPAAEVGRKAAERALGRLGARQVSTTRVPVIFDPECASGLLGQIARAASGDTIVKNASYLVGKLGEPVACEQLTIVDDPTIPGALGSRPFDAEGVASAPLTLVEEGRLAAYLLDTRTARRLEMTPTGHAASEPGSEPVVAPSNLRVRPGTTSLEEMVKGLSRGLLVTDLIGFGLNLVTGDYSRGASGLWIEGGEIVYPVEEITIAGNLLDMLLGIEAIGDDPSPERAVSAPSLLIGQMTIAGA